MAYALEDLGRDLQGIGSLAKAEAALDQSLQIVRYYLAVFDRPQFSVAGAFVLLENTIQCTLCAHRCSAPVVSKAL